MRPEQRKSGLWNKSLELFPIKVILFIAKDWGWTSKSLQFARWLKTKREEMEMDHLKMTFLKKLMSIQQGKNIRHRPDKASRISQLHFSSFPSKGQVYTWTSIAAELVFTQNIAPWNYNNPTLAPRHRKRAGTWALRSPWIHSLLL